MNRTEAKELLPVITAFANGEEIEVRTADEGWQLVREPMFYPGYPYRIAPKPKTCERWCFAVWVGHPFSHSCGSESAAADKKSELKRDYPDATFSPIVRVEFVEEQTA